MLNASQVIQNLRKHWNLDFFGITSSKFNETTSFQTNFKDNFDGFHIIKSTNFITHRIEIKII